MAGVMHSEQKNDRAVSPVADDFASKLCLYDVPLNDFVIGYENPVTWHRKFNVPREQLTKDVLFDNMDMKIITLAQYNLDKPEYIKWKLYIYNIVICYEYISKGKLNSALETMNDIEDILLSIGADDPFLKSIRIALNHITFSMKGHLLKLCGLDTTMLERFVMPNNMNNVNKSGLYGIQSVYFYEYGLPYAHISKDSALKAISLNEVEAEWYFLMAKVLTNWQRTCGNYFECSEQEIQASEMAVNLANKNHHKLHLAHIYHRMSRNMRNNGSIQNQIMDSGFQLVNEVIDSTNDLFLLKNCLLSLSKISLNKHDDDYNINTLLQKLISKLETSDNGYVHGAIGNYYLFNKKNYVKANFHLKKAFDAKSFGSSIDYIYTLYKMNEKTAPVEQMLVEMLKNFSHPVHQEKLISQIVSYLIVTNNKIIQALKYIKMLLNIKNVTCVYSLLTHRTKFARYNKSLNLLEAISEKLNSAVNNPILSADHIEEVKEVMQMLELYELYVSDLIKDKQHIFGNCKKKYNVKNDVSHYKNNEHKDVQNYKNHKPDKTYVKNTAEENWRTLKPDPNVNARVFSRSFQK